jgi:hypothetical protein
MNNETNPYATYASNAQPKLHMDVSDQFKVHQKEEQEQKAPKILPHPIDSYLIDINGQMYINLMKMRDFINKVESEPKRNKQAIRQIQSLIEEIGKKITELYVPIDKLYL